MWSGAPEVSPYSWSIVLADGCEAFASKLVTATPSGNFLIFDIGRGRLGRSSHARSIRPSIKNISQKRKSLAAIRAR